MTNEEISFREHFESLLASIEKLQDERWHAHEYVHTALEDARHLALKDVGRRLDELNKLRDEVTTDRVDFLIKDVFYVKHDELSRRMDDKVTEVTKRLDVLERTRANYEGRLWAFGAIFTAVVIGINLLLKFLFK